MTSFDKSTVIEGECFSQMRIDANAILQKLLENMVEKDAYEGSMTIKICVSLEPHYILVPPEERTEETGETRRALVPQFDHKIASTMQIKGEAKGKYSDGTMELVHDSNTNMYVLTPLKEGGQMNLYDYMDEDGMSGNAVGDVYGYDDEYGYEEPDTDEMI